MQSRLIRKIKFCAGAKAPCKSCDSGDAKSGVQNSSIGSLLCSCSKPLFRGKHEITLGKDNSIEQKRKTAKYHAGKERLQAILGKKYDICPLPQVYKVVINETVVAQTPYGEEEFVLCSEGLQKELEAADFQNLMREWH